MATKANFLKQFSYSANANLVLNQDRRGKPAGEPTGEAESLWGKIEGQKMGDRFLRVKPTDLEGRVNKIREAQKGKAKDEILDMEKSRRRAADVLAATERLESLGYKPKTKETKAAYEVLLNMLQRSLGEQPRDVLRNVSEEVLMVLKNDSLKDSERKKLIEENVGSMSEEEMAQYISVGKRITDFTIEEEEAVASDDEGQAVEAVGQGASVLFEQDEEEEGDERDVVVEEPDAVEEEEGNGEGELKAAEGEDEKAVKLDRSTLDGWLLEFFQSEDMRTRLLHDVWETLKEPGDDRSIENKLVLLLGYDKFDLIKKLMKGRANMATETGSWTQEALNKVHNLDLDALAFAAGGHTMTNRKCHLPPGSKTISNKGYEAVFVPALARRSLEPGEVLVDIGEMPAWAQPAFKIKNLNRVQSRVYKTAFSEADSFLLCAPTGAGKTNVALLAMLHEIGMNMDEQGVVDLDSFKMIYVAPMKALVQEMVRNFSDRLGYLGVKVKELSGDQQLSREQIQDTQLIITTPEKWDIITRKSGDRTFTQLVRLVIFDEIHLLHDDRGPVIESLVARTLRQVESTQQMVRMVGLSATLPNYEDVAMFLRVDPSKIFHFDSTFRPVPLEQKFIGVTEKKALKRMQVMNDLTYEYVMDYAGKHQVLVFVHSRKETAKTARALRDMALQKDTLAKFMENDMASREVLAEAASNGVNPVKNPDLKELLPYGFAIHHAGLSRSDRELVESMFEQKHVKVLVSTATLAWGVNLPAHAVIIKGTKIYSPERGAWMELSPLDVMQMMGRAGRPGFDSYGEGIIITGHAELQYYLSLLNQQLPIESQFVKDLANNLNAEVVLGTINSIKDAATWLTYTYLYVRMLRNPTVYGIPEEELDIDPRLEQRRVDLVHSAALVLAKENLIKYDRRTGTLQATDLGRVAAHYYISHSSMATYNSHMKPSMTEIDLFRVFSLSDEFKFLAVREEEKLELQKLLEQVPIPVKESPEEGCAKINVLLQAYISQLRLDGFALVCDMVYVTQSAGRLLRALFEIALRRGWNSAAVLALNLCKKVDRRIWGTMSPLRQLPIKADIKLKVVKKIERTDFPLERLFDLTPHEIGELVAMPQLGKTLHKLIHQIPRVEVLVEYQPLTPSLLRVRLTIKADFQWDEKIHGTAETFWVFVSDSDEESLLYYDQVVIKQKYATDDHYINFYLPLLDPVPPQYFVRVTSDRWMGSDTVKPISFRKLIPPFKMYPYTTLEQVDPLSLDVLECPQFTKIYAARGISVLNAVQTQAYSSLYESNETVMVSAPTGTGKSLCAELAMMRVWLQIANTTSEKADELVGPNQAGFKKLTGSGKILCLTTSPDAAIRRFVELVDKFSSVQLPGRLTDGIKFAVLTGEPTYDTKLFTSDLDVLVCSADQWDGVTRRWTKGKVAKALAKLSLVVADDLHMLGDDETGHVYESVISRTRCVLTQLQASTRFVGLSAAVANATDIGQWIGVVMDPRTLEFTSGKVYSFNSTARPVPMEARFITSDMGHPPSRFLSFTRNVFDVLMECAERNDTARDSVVFVPSRKQALMQALDIYTFLCSQFEINAATGRADDADSMSVEGGKTISDVSPFILMPYSEWKEQVSLIADPVLAQLLAAGIGLVYEGMRDRDREILDALCAVDALGVVVVSSRMSWSVSHVARNVLIVDTVRYEGKEHRYVDIPTVEIDYMMGRAGRQTRDSTGTVVVFCHTKRREFYKEFLFRPLPLESRLDRDLHDELNAEIVAQTVNTMQAAVDFLTWTFFYHRITKNPNYYNLQGVTAQAVSAYLSDLVETVVSDLRTAACIREAADEEDASLEPNNLGIIASHYNVHAVTVDLFAASLKPNIGFAGLLDVVCSATEFDYMEMRRHEDMVIRKLANRLASPADGADQEASDNPLASRKFSDPHTKAGVLLRAHFSRQRVSPELTLDTKMVVEKTVHLVQALVDVASSQTTLKPALRAMKLSQMCVQAVWNKDSVFRQIPHFTDEMITRAKEMDLGGVEDILSMEEEQRALLLQGLTQQQVNDVALYCNRYPSVTFDTEVSVTDTNVKEVISAESGDVDLGELESGAEVVVSGSISSEGDEDESTAEPVVAPYYPKPKIEHWWVVVGNEEANSLASLKRMALAGRAAYSIKFNAPSEPGQYTYNVYFVNDSYMGVDDSYSINFRISGSGDRKRDMSDNQEESKKRRVE